MLKVIKTWRQRRRQRVQYEAPTTFDEQLLFDLGLTWDDVRKAQIKRTEASSEGAVFP